MPMPVGGQKGLALGCTVARRRLSFAASMYVAQAARPMRTCLAKCGCHALSFSSIRAREVAPGTGFYAARSETSRSKGFPTSSVKKLDLCQWASGFSVSNRLFRQTP